MLKRKLWKQVLPMLLSVAMLLGEMPVTALAAGDTQPDEIVVEEAASLQADGAGEETSAIKVDGPDDIGYYIDDIDDGNNPRIKYDRLDNVVTIPYLWEGDPNYGLDVDKVVNAMKNVITAYGNPVYWYDDDDDEYKEDVLMEYKWQEESASATDGWADLEASKKPINVGTYRLLASRRAEEYGNPAIDWTKEPIITLNITPATLYISNIVTNPALVSAPPVNGKSGYTAQYLLDDNKLDNITLKYKYTDAAGATQWVSMNKEQFVARDAEGKASYSVKVQKLADGKLEDVAGTEILKRNEDYFVVFDITLSDLVKKNYVFDSTSFAVEHFTKRNVDVLCDYVNQSELIVKYVDEEFDIEKGFYENLRVTDAGLKDNVITDPAFEDLWDKTWKNSNGDTVAAPKEPGVYTYKITLKENDMYTVTTPAEIRVEIRSINLVVKPEIDQKLQLQEGANVSDILKQVNYTVTRTSGPEGVSGNDLDLSKEDPDFWGVYADSAANQRERYFQPQFVIEQGVYDKNTEKTTGWAEFTGSQLLNYDNYTTKATTYRYRIVFSGKKGVYGADGSAVTADINSTIIKGKYTVDTTDSAKELYAVPLEVSDAKLVVIDVDALVKDGGATLEKPISRYYNGDGLYPTKNDYKKATATVSTGEAGKPGDLVASNAELTYTWWKVDTTAGAENNGWNAITDEKGNVTYEVANWIYAGAFNDVGKLSAPKDAGVYRLEVTLNKDGYYCKPAYVYYVIKPQLAMIEMADADKPLEIYADGKNTIQTLFDMIQGNDKLYKLTLYSVKLDKDDKPEKDAGGKYVKDAAIKDDKLADAMNKILYWPSTYAQVEKQIVAGEKKDQWEAITDLNTKFDNALSYRLTMKAWAVENLFDGNYNFGMNLDDYNRIQKDDSYYYPTRAIKLPETEVKYVNIDGYKTLDSKEYDGTALFSEADIKKITDNVSVYTLDDTEVTEDINKKNLLQYRIVDYASENNNGVKYPEYDPVTKTWNKTASERELTLDQVKYGGTYYVEAYLPTDAEYRTASKVVGKFTITPKKLTVTLERKEKIYAGLYIPKWTGTGSSTQGAHLSDILKVHNASNNTVDIYPANVQNYTVEGALKDDKPVYFYDNSKYIGIYKSTGEPVNDEFLMSNQRYYVRLLDYEFSNIAEDFSGTTNLISQRRNYYVDLADQWNEFTAQPVATAVESVATQLKHTYKYEDDKPVHEITAQTGASVPYYQSGANGTFTTVDYHDNTKEYSEGNYLTMRIYAPLEYQNKGKDFKDLGFTYNNSIHEAGGYVYGVGNGRTIGSKTYSNWPYILVAFNVAENLEKLPKTNRVQTFDIYWTKDVVETYKVDFDKLTLAADLSKAVAPKTLAFTAKKSSLAVGEMKQLEVKVTKKQKSDTIYLAYESSNESVVKVSSSGYVTALAKGSATITVYPCQKINGQNVKIASWKKKATITINVTELSKPASLGFTLYDTKAEVKYKKPANGARREIYILKDDIKKADVFEAAIKRVQNGDYKKEFVDAIFVGTETTDAKGIVLGNVVTGLQPGTTYTAYVRNVSRVITLSDGTQTQVKVAGAVKKFTTKKTQPYTIMAGFDKVAVRDDNFDQQTSGQLGYQYAMKADYTVLNSAMYYEAPLASGSAKLTLKGYYKESAKTNYSDGNDYIERVLPLNKNKDPQYYSPSLAYYVYNYAKVGTKKADKTDPDFANWVYFDGNYNYYKSSTFKAFTVDKKGKVTFKGRGAAFIRVQDTLDDNNYCVLYLKVTANADTMKTKNVKNMQVGTSVSLKSSGYVTYYQKKKALNATSSGQLTSNTYEDPNGNFKIEQVGDDIKVTALKPSGKKKLTLKLTDSEVASNGGKGNVAITITSKAAVAVKALKGENILDTNFDLTWTHPEKNQDFLIGLKAPNGLGYSTIESMTGTWDAKKNAYVYSININDVKSLAGAGGLSRLTAYTMSVTAVYENPVTKELFKSKAVTKKVTTTNIPASTVNVNDTYYGPDGANNRGGVKIVASVDKGSKYDGTWSTYTDGAAADISVLPLVAGNSYTLSPANNAINAAARERMTDTLVWKIKNKNVASVRAVAGSYSATLKAVKAGTTVLEVSSKVTKKVIARYDIAVVPVGNAEAFYGDYEESTAASIVTPEMIANAYKLTADSTVTVTLNSYESQDFAFTAPAYGQYTFIGQTYSTTAKNWVGAGAAFSVKTGTTASTQTLEKGEVALVTMTNKQVGQKAYRVSVTANKTCVDLVVGDNNIVKYGQYVRFVAPEDNCYTVEYFGDDNKWNAWKGETAYAREAGFGKDGNDDLDTQFFGLPNTTTGKEYKVRITKREIEGTFSVDTEAAIKLNGKTDGATTTWETKWYAFTADADNIYNFYTTEATKKLEVYYYTDLTTAGYSSYYQLGNMDISSGDTNWSVSTTRDAVNKMKTGDKRYLRITVNDATAVAGTPVTAKLKVKKTVSIADANKSTAVGTATNVSIPQGTNVDVWYSFTAPSAGIYNFVCTPSEGFTTLNSVEYYKNVANTTADYTGETVADITLAKDETIYVKLNALNAPASATVAIMATTRNFVKDTVLTADGKEIPVSVAAGKYDSWYRFTPDEYNCYTFTLTGAKPGSTASIDLYASLEAPTTMGASKTDLPLKNGETIYVRLVAPSTDDALKLKIEKRKTVELKTDVSTNDIVLADSSDSKWYVFTADETNVYTFYMTATDGIGYGTKASVYFYNDILGKNPIKAKNGSNLGATLTSTLTTLEQEYQKGTRVYLKASSANNNNTTVSIQVRKRVAPTTVLKVDAANDAISVENVNDEKWAKFTVDSNYYDIRFATTKQVEISLYDDWKSIKLLNDDSDYCETFVSGGDADDFDGGTKKFEYGKGGKNDIFVRIRALEADASVTPIIKARKVEDKALSATEANTIELGKWYKFDAPEYNVYEFDADVSTGDVELYYVDELWRELNYYSGYYAYRNADSSSSEIEGGLFGEKELSNGDPVYVMAKLASGSTATVKMTISKRVKEYKTLSMTNVSSNDLEFTKAGERNAKWYMFKADEVNTYTFLAAASKGTAKFQFYMNKYGIDDSQYVSADFNTDDDYGYDKFFQNTKMCYIKVWVSEPATVSMKVTKRVEPAKGTELKVGADGNKLTLKYMADDWYVFVPDEANVYNIKMTGNDDNTKVEYYFAESVFMAGREEGVDYLGNKVWNVTPGTPITTTSSASISTSAAGSGNNKIYFRVRNTKDTKLTGSEVTLTITKRVLNSQKLTTAKGVSVELNNTKDENKEAWFEFTADEPNCYTFYADDVTPGDITLRYYESMDKTGLGTWVNNTGKEIALEDVVVNKKGAKGYVKVELRNGTAANATLQVKRREPKAITIPLPDTHPQVSGNDFIEELSFNKDSKELWFSFTVGKKQNYAFYLEDVSNGNLKATYYTALTQKTGTERTADATYATKSIVLTSGEMDPESNTAKTIYIKVEPNAAITGDTVVKANLVACWGDAPIEKTVKGTGAAGTNVVFVATHTTKYYFWSTRPPKTTLNDNPICTGLTNKNGGALGYNSGDLNTDYQYSLGDGNFAFDINLTRGDVVNLNLRDVASGDYNYTLHITTTTPKL